MQKLIDQHRDTVARSQDKLNEHLMRLWIPNLIKRKCSFVSGMGTYRIKFPNSICDIDAEHPQGRRLLERLFGKAAVDALRLMVDAFPQSPGFDWMYSEYLFIRANTAPYDHETRKSEWYYFL